MTAMLEQPRIAAEQIVREVLEERETSRDDVGEALRDLLRDTLRLAVKDVVKEAVREVNEESMAPSRPRGRLLLAAGIGVAIGYLAAKGRGPAEW